MSKWTLSDINKLQAKGLKVKGDVPKNPEAAGIKYIESILISNDIDYEKEYRFDRIRKYRFDFCIPAIKVGIEYEGLISKKSGHTTLEGYTKDCNKYNLAQLNGYIVLRYSALNFENFKKDIINILD